MSLDGRQVGVLPSLERDESKKIIESYGGRVTTAVSGKTNYLLAGRDAGKSKTDTASKRRIKIISEDDLLEMIRTRPGTIKADTKANFNEPVKRSASGKVDEHALIKISKDQTHDDGRLCT